MVNITEEEYGWAYKEVYYIIKFLDDDIRDKIPDEKIEFYRSHMDNSHEFRYDINKDINDRNLLYPTKCILSNLFKEYIATEEDKTLIKMNEQKELNKLEEEKREKYNPDNIFKKENRKMAISAIEIEEVSTDMIVSEKEETFIEKIKNKILKILNLE